MWNVKRSSVSTMNPASRRSAPVSQRAGVPAPDGHALALILIEPMSAYRFIGATFGRTPDGLDDERLIATWVDVCLAYARAHRLDDA
jgi:hypothetical protein